MVRIEVDEEIVLRLLTARDAKRLFTLTDESRDYLKKWLPWVELIRSEEDSLRFIKQALQDYLDFEKIIFGIIYHGELVGVIGFNRLDTTNKIASIGYWLAEKYSGQGIMTRSVAAFISYGFSDLLLHKIEIRVATENKQSRAVPERLDFVQEGIIRAAEKLNHTYVDHVLYGILKDEW